MTPADHANTLRDALRYAQAKEFTATPGYAKIKAAYVALDVLQAQAETAETLPPAHSAQWWQEVAEDLDERVKKMRAERDAAVHERDRLRTEWQAEAASDAVAFSNLKAERDAAVRQRDAMLQFVQAEQPPDEVFRALQREHGLPETGAPKHPAEQAAEEWKQRANFADAYKYRARAEAAEQAAEQAKEAYTNVKRDYDDVFGQLLRRHSDVDRAEQAAEQAREAVAALEKLALHHSQAAEQARNALQDVRAWIAQEEEVGALVPTIVYEIIDASLAGGTP